MNCEICNKKLVIFVKLQKFDLLKCDNCDHIISNLKISKKYLKETYSKNYLIQKHKNWMNNPNNEFYEKIENFILKNNIEKILDLGCGKGLLLKFLKKRNPSLKLTGVDLYKHKKNKKIDFINKDIFKFKSKKEFSMIVSVMVIEHIKKIKPFIKLIKKLTKNKSYCVINTINTNSILYKISHFFYYFNFKTPFSRLYDPHHLNHFSNKSLKKIFLQNGFSLVEIIKTPITMKQVDYPYDNIIKKYFFYVGIYLIIKLQNIFGFSWIQTIVFKKKN